MGRKIQPHVPLLDRETQTKGMLTRAEFSFDRKRDVYVCPTGHDLRTTGHVIPGGLKQYRAKPSSCGPCALKAGYTTGAARMVTRNVHEDEPRIRPSSKRRPTSGARWRCSSPTSSGTSASDACGCEA
jgi:hypothetical protein